MESNPENNAILKIKLDHGDCYQNDYNYNLVKRNIIEGNINPNGEIIDTPKSMKIELKYHQKRLLYEMVKKEHIDFRTSSGINMACLADKVGSGKSIDILSLISNSKYVDSIMNNKLMYRVTKYSAFKGLVLEPTKEYKTNLIVIPHGIYNQWKVYIETITNLSYYGISSKKDLDMLNLNQLLEENYDIILVKSTRYNDFMSKIYSIHPWTIDNFHTINTNISEDFNSLLSEVSKTYFNLKDSNYDNDFLENLENLKENLVHTNIDDIKQKLKQLGKYKLSLSVKYKGPIFQRVFFDEANSIKIPRCQYAYGKMNWFITSSVEDLLEPYGKKDYYAGKVIINGIKGSGFIKDIFNNNSGRHYCNFLQDIYLKNKDQFIKDSFNLPEPIENKITCYTPPELKALQGVAIPEVIQALNAGDLNTAIQQVGCNISNEKNIVDLVLSNLNSEFSKKNSMLEQKNSKLDLINLKITELKDEKQDIKTEISNLNITTQSIDEINSIKSNYESLLGEIQKNLEAQQQNKASMVKSIKILIDQIDNLTFKIDALKSRITNIKDKDCPICAQPINSPCMTPCCKNIFCFSCMAQAIHYSPSNECPLCRHKNLSLSKLTAITCKIIPKQEENKLPTKTESLINLLLTDDLSKVLIFSEYEHTLNDIKLELEKNNITYSKLSGSSGRITNIIDNYSKNKTKVLLLNAKHYGSGLNLQMTTDIIIYHRMSNDLERQIIGRGQRLGRTSALKIHYLCYENEL